MSAPSIASLRHGKIRAWGMAFALLALSANISAMESFTETIEVNNPNGFTINPEFFYSAPAADGVIVSWTIVVTSAIPDGPGGSKVLNDHLQSDGDLRIKVHVPAHGSFTATVTVFWEHKPANSDLAPVITTPDHIVVGNDLDVCGAVVCFTVTATDDHDGDVTVTCVPASGSLFECGSTTVTCTATDSTGHTAHATFTVTVQDCQPPTLTLPANICVSNDPGKCGAVVTFTATANDNCDGAVTVVCAPPSGSEFECGAPTIVSCTATDLAGNVAHGSFTVTVRDTEPPTVSPTAAVPVLWSPNHNFVDVGLNFGATDNCELASVKVLGVTQDEPLTALGSGVFGPDAKITTDTAGNKHLWLRAERAGTLDGRVYLIQVRAVDTSGNSAVGTCTVVVPKSKSTADVNSVLQQAAAATAPLLFDSFEIVRSPPRAKG